MKKIYPIIVVLVIIIGVVGFFVFVQNSTRPKETDPPTTIADRDSGSKTTEKEAAMEKSNGAMDEQDTGATTEGGERYVPYSTGILEATADTRRVLFFYANWCPTCRPADAEFDSNTDKIPADVTLIRVNYNDTETDEEDRALAQRYGVTYQHTFVQLDSDGNEVTKWNGGATAELLQNIR